MEQATSQRRFTQSTYTACTSTLTENGNVIWISTKLSNILFHPLQRLNLVENTIVSTDVVRTLFRQFRIGHEAKDTQAIVNRNEHHILRSPLLSIKLRFRPPALAVASTMNPQSYGQFLINLSRSLCIDIQIQAVLTIGSLITIAPLSGIATRVMNRLVTRMAKLITESHAIPSHYRLRFFPTQITNRRCSIRNTFVNIHIRILAFNTLDLTTFNTQHRTCSLFIRGAAHQCHKRHQQ